MSDLLVTYAEYIFVCACVHVCVGACVRKREPKKEAICLKSSLLEETIWKKLQSSERIFYTSILLLDSTYP